MKSENFFELVDILDVIETSQYQNMVDIDVQDDHSFLLSTGLISHNSAAGSVKQARDSETDAIYALKGKVKNARKLSDLTANAEWLDIMSILEIEPGNKKLPVYEKIIIATDEDADGQHISSLIISFFHKWFPQIIEDKRLYRIITPLVSCDVGKERKYFYTTEDFNEFAKKTKVSNVKYLKGLGSLSLKDWEYVMSHKIFFSVINDRSADRFLNIAFGDSSLKRKKWLEKK